MGFRTIYGQDRCSCCRIRATPAVPLPPLSSPLSHVGTLQQRLLHHVGRATGSPSQGFRDTTLLYPPQELLNSRQHLGRQVRMCATLPYTAYQRLRCSWGHASESRYVTCLPVCQKQDRGRQLISRPIVPLSWRGAVM